MRQLDKLTAGKYGGTGEGGVLVIQYSMKYSVTAKVDANSKSDASDASKIGTPKVKVKRGIGKQCAVAVALSRHVYFRNQALRES